MEAIYLQITTQLKKIIILGNIKEGDALPSLRTLACELGISTITIRHAYQELEKQGFIVTVAGKGSFVATKRNDVIKREASAQIDKCLQEVALLSSACAISDAEIIELYKKIKQKHRL